MNIPIIYEDDALLIVDKPAGLLTVPTPKKETGTLTDLINMEFKNKREGFSLYPCHRLDRETSGLLVYAKGKAAQHKMSELFRSRSIKKLYIAFVHGTISHDRGVIDRPIEGQSAKTEFRVLERRKDFTIVEVSPKTGRTNQIRIHFKSIGHPIVGEKRFAFRKDFSLTANRLCLHAAKLEFIHPMNNNDISAESTLPLAMTNFLGKHPQ
jgi:23S rRNA pseudouridine1911/1915/1917 synthase